MITDKFDNVVSEKEFAAMVGLSLSNVRRRRYRKELPYIRIDRRVCYRISDAERFIESHRRNTSS